MNPHDVHDLHRRCREALDSGPDAQDQLARVLDGITPSDASIDALATPDPRRPYGRRVLFATETLEAMVATWTRDRPCAPHDHGGAVGGVRVLRGEAVHHLFRVADGALERVGEERVGRGGVISCGPELVHAMADGGGAEALVTLHLYSGPITHMVVYDVDGDRTVVVDGGCGAWLPWDEAHLIRAVVAGFRTPAELARQGHA